MGKTEDINSVLVLNARLSSIKFAVFAAGLAETLSSIAAVIEGASFLAIEGNTETSPFIYQKSALIAVLTELKSHGCNIKTPKAAVHQVVHGSHKLTAPVSITADVRSESYNRSPLASQHNPNNLAAIDSLNQIVPELLQFASFDRSFHATNLDVVTRYPIPRMMETKGIRRYGFYGLFYVYLVTHLPKIFSKKLPLRLLVFHLGNVASLCAIHNGQSIATTMGYSPLNGITMGMRSGGIAANAALRLLEENGLERTKAILNYEGGLLGLSAGRSDKRNLMLNPSKHNAVALEHFCYWSLHHAGSLISTIEGVDAIAFTGSIGENAFGVRVCILLGLEWRAVRINSHANHRNELRLHAESSKVKAWVIPAIEEQMIAIDALTLMGAA